MSQLPQNTTIASTPSANARRVSMAGPIVRPALAGKTHYLRVETLDPAEVETAAFTLCNTPRNGAEVLRVDGIQVTCKRCLKLDELNRAG